MVEKEGGLSKQESMNKVRQARRKKESKKASRRKVWLRSDMKIEGQTEEKRKKETSKQRSKESVGKIERKTERNETKRKDEIWRIMMKVRVTSLWEKIKSADNRSK